MPWTNWASVPTGEQNWLAGMADIWLQTVGFRVPLGSAELFEMANAGVETQRDMGQFIQRQWGAPWQVGGYGRTINEMPWSAYGLDKDTYAQMTSTFGTEYKKVTGQDIGKEALQQAFQNPRDPTGGLLSASQYAQQLMNDTNIQNTYGWVKYGLDYSQWTQQKLSMRSAFGRDINDAEAATVLQYNKTAAGPNMSAVARLGSQQQTPTAAGISGSVAR